MPVETSTRSSGAPASGLFHPLGWPADRLTRYATIRFGLASLIVLGTGGFAIVGGRAGSGPVLWTCGIGLLSLAASLWWARSRPHSQALIYAQLAHDAVLTSMLCAVTGGVQTPFVLLYFPSIAAGAFQLRLLGALIAAGLASLGLIAVAAMSTAEAAGGGSVLIYTESARIFAFFLVATLTGQLAEAAERSGQALVAELKSSAILASEHEMVLDRVRAAVLTLNHEQRIVGMNPSALRLLGDVAGASISEVLTGSPQQGAWEEARDGGRRWLCCADPLPNGGRVIVIDDVTELTRMRELATRDERLVGVGRLAASMAHEIRNPLASLTGSLQLIAEDSRDESETRLLEIALREAQRLNRLVEEFLSMSRSRRIEPRPTDLRAMVDEVAAAFSSDARFRGAVRVLGYGPPAVAEVDPDRVRQVLWNLVLNGAQAMPRGGDIRLTVEQRAEYEHGPEGVEIRVTDDGIGISDADRTCIFDPFFTTRSGGSGLGLAVVEQVVSAHGGRIAVRAPAEGGTAFVLWFPKEAHVG